MAVPVKPFFPCMSICSRLPSHGPLWVMDRMSAASIYVAVEATLALHVSGSLIFPLVEHAFALNPLSLMDPALMPNCPATHVATARTGTLAVSYSTFLGAVLC